MHRDKTRDMIRSILPSTRRKWARYAKAEKNRRHRRAVRQKLNQARLNEELQEDFYYNPVKPHEYYLSERRGGDKLNHFIEWAIQKTKHLETPRERLDYISALLPKDLIGQHAKGHIEGRDEFNIDPYRYSWRRRPYRNPYLLTKKQITKGIQEIYESGGHHYINLYMLPLGEEFLFTGDFVNYYDQILNLEAKYNCFRQKNHPEARLVEGVGWRIFDTKQRQHLSALIQVWNNSNQNLEKLRRFVQPSLEEERHLY